MTNLIVFEGFKEEIGKSSQIIISKSLLISESCGLADEKLSLFKSVIHTVVMDKLPKVTL